LTDLLAALGLMLVLEGALYALFPTQMKRAIATVLGQAEQALRTAGLAAALIGLMLVWLARSGA
jgi:uncharacterized protein